MNVISKLVRRFGHLKERLLAEKVDLYKDEINNRNYHSFIGLTVVGSAITGSILIIGMPLPYLFTYNKQIFVLFCISLILYFIGKSFLQKEKKYSTLAFYCALTPIMLMGILMGTFLDPKVPSVTIMVFLCVLTLFMIDKPWRIILYITCSAVLYAIFCYYAKAYELFLTDVVHLFAFYCMAVGVNYLTVKERIDNVESFVNYRIRSEIDLMTGVFNREVGLNKIKELINNGIQGAFIIVDIDNFKRINDNFGHMYGDIVIKKVSHLIKKSFHEEDVVLRMGGDEFIVYSVNLVELKECKKRLEGLLDCFNSSEAEKEEGISVSISIGCSINDKVNIDFNRLYRESDRCLYVAKQAGKGCCVIKE